MESGAHQKQHCLRKKQNTYAIFILTTKTVMKCIKKVGKDDMTVTKSKRVLEGQKRLQQILNGVRGSSETTLSKENAEYLCNFHIDNKNCFNQQDKQQIKKDALYLFANV